MEKVPEQFKAMAPVIIDKVKICLTGGESEETKLAIISNEIDQFLYISNEQHRRIAQLIYGALLLHEQPGVTAVSFESVPTGAPENGLKLDKLPEVAQAKVLEILRDSLNRMAPGVNNQNTADIKQAASAVRIAVKELYS